MTIQESKSVLSGFPKGFGETEIQRAAGEVTKAVVLRTQWYENILNSLEDSAVSYLRKLGVSPNSIEVQGVPGSFELPLAALQVASSVRPPDLIVALGCVIRGDTPHFDFVCSAVSQGLINVQLQTRVPLGFGILTVENLEQALARKEKGAEAAQAAFAMYLRARRFPSVKGI